MNPGILRFKAALATHGKVMTGALLVIGVLAIGGAAWVYTHPPVTEFTEQTNSQTVQTEVDTSAYVRGNTTMWETGDRLRNAELYPSAAPVLSVRVTTTVPASDTGQVYQELTLVHRVVRDGTVIWENEVPVSNGSSSVSDGRAVLSGSIDTRSVRKRKDEIDQELTGVATSEVLLRVNTSYEVGTYSGVLSNQAPLRIAQQGHWVDGSLDDERTHTGTVRRTTTRPPDIATVGGLAAIGVGALLAGGLVLVSQYRLPPAATIRERLECERYDEWISEAVFEGDLPNRRLKLRSLEGLVNLGIDSKKRTFYDPDRGLYGVVDDDVLYYYVETTGRASQSSSEDEWDWPFDEPTVDTPR